jgi:hypothetical protein
VGNSVQRHSAFSCDTSGLSGYRLSAGVSITAAGGWNLGNSGHTATGTGRGFAAACLGIKPKLLWPMINTSYPIVVLRCLLKAAVLRNYRCGTNTVRRRNTGRNGRHSCSTTCPLSLGLHDAGIGIQPNTHRRVLSIQADAVDPKMQHLAECRSRAMMHRPQARSLAPTYPGQSLRSSDVHLLQLLVPGPRAAPGFRGPKIGDLVI